MTKICQISDVHIRNYKYHGDYRKVFDILYSEIKNVKPDLIVNSGDTVHQKLNLSPACFKLTSELLHNLDAIAPQIIILGNHDLSLSNPHKVDAIAPVVSALKHNNNNTRMLFYPRSVFDVELTCAPGICWHVFSLLDKENWKALPLNKDKINIALYHGGVAGVKTDAGWVIEHGVKLATFAEFDFVMLGDIHKPNQIVDDEGRMRYAGSLCQNSFGEENNKGFLLWEIDSKNQFSCQHIHIPNPKPFVSVNLTPSGRLPNKLQLPPTARVRLITERSLPLDAVRRVIESTKIKFKPESVSFLNKPAVNSKSDTKISYTNLRDVSVQEKLIKEHLKDYEISDEVLRKIYEINNLYNSRVANGSQSRNNTHWKINKLRFGNLFNYAGGNSIDFSKLRGVIGLFGKNFSGKSSVIDSALYTAFNTTSKNIRKNLAIINEHKQDAFGELELEIDGESWKIKRTSEKYTKKLKGVETEEAKTEVHLSKIIDGEEFSQNELSRNETDKVIRSKLGTIEDFLLTSMSSQFGFLQFIDEGSTRRKEILAKFLDLELFEKKYQLANKDSLSLKTNLKNLEGREYGREIDEQEFFLSNLVETKIPRLQDLKEVAGTEKNVIEAKIESEQEALLQIPEDVSIYPTLKCEFDECKIEIDRCNAEIKKQQEQKQQKEQDKKKAIKELADIPKEDDLEIFSGLREHMLDCRKKAQLLGEVPCGKEFDRCKFKIEAVQALEDIPDATENFTDHAEALGFDEDSDVGSSIARRRSLENKIQVLTKNILQKELSISSLQDTLRDKTLDFEMLTEKIEQFEEKQDIIDNYEGIKADIATLQIELAKKKQEINDLEQKIFKAYQTKGSIEQKINSLRNRKKELEDLRKEYEAYDLFLRAFHSNGISYSIIRQNLPVINEEIAKILMNVVSFDIYFESNNKKLDILIKHPKHSPRPIETTSGAEKTLAAVAIRLAFIKVSTLPMSNILVLDEPGTNLDEEHLDGFTKILEVLKTQFDTIILISHLEHLKDFVDEQIIIEKENGYAKVQI